MRWSLSRNFKALQNDFYSPTMRRIGCRQGYLYSLFMWMNINFYFKNHFLANSNNDFQLKFQFIWNWNDFFTLHSMFVSWEFIFIIPREYVTMQLKNIWISEKKENFLHKLTINFNPRYWIKVITSSAWIIFNACIRLFYLLLLSLTTLDYGNFNEIDFFFAMTLSHSWRGCLKEESFSICFVVQRQRENLQKIDPLLYLLKYVNQVKNLFVVNWLIYECSSHSILSLRCLKSELFIQTEANSFALL